MDIRVRVHLAHFRKIRVFWALFECSSAGNIWLLPVLKCLKRAKNILIFQKCAKCTQTLRSNHEINFDYKLRFYISKMNEICLRCHWFYFSSIILSFGQCALPRFDLVSLTSHENSNHCYMRMIKHS